MGPSVFKDMTNTDLVKQVKQGFNARIPLTGNLEYRPSFLKKQQFLA